jgi:hypothetical protein
VAVWQWLLDSAGAVLLLIVCFGLLLVVRRRVISRNGGTFELSVRVRPAQSSGPAGRGWVLGLGRYDGGTLQWFRLFSPVPRPRYEWKRDELALRGHRQPTGAESMALFSGHVVVECETFVGRMELAMSPSALTGFQSWLEAGPPGTEWGQRPTSR